MADKNNKRIKERIPLREEVKLFVKDMENFLTEYADNISQGGMFIKSSNPLPIGTQFDLELSIGSEDQKIKAIGEVVWTKEFSSESDRPSGMGVRFIKIQAESKKMIRDLIEKA